MESSSLILDLQGAAIFQQEFIRLVFKSKPIVTLQLVHTWD